MVKKQASETNMNRRVHNIKALKENRVLLRRSSTPAEKALWKMLQRSQLEGRKFRRQHSVDGYVLDFYCPAEKLAIEVDGAQHYTTIGLGNDQERTAFLNNLNIRVLRFENKEVFENINAVIESIKECFTTPDPS